MYLSRIFWSFASGSPGSRSIVTILNCAPGRSIAPSDFSAISGSAFDSPLSWRLHSIGQSA